MQEQQKDKENLDSFMCPSFNYYFTDQDMNKIQNDAAFSASLNDDTDFAFAAFRDDPAFFDDAVFPLFESELPSDGRDSTAAVLRFPINGDEHERSSAAESDSSSEADELEGVPSGTYCVWTPNSPQASPAKCKKSNSTGSSSSAVSKKWKLLDLLRRSNSEGRQWFLFLTAGPEKKKVNERWSIEVAGKSKEKKKVAISAHEALYVRNREMRMVDKRKSFLPYKPHLLGFSASRFAKPFLPK